MASNTGWLPLRLALREMRGGLRGFYVFIACIALGAMSIAGVGSLAASLGETLYLAGMVLFLYNIVRTWQTRPAAYAEASAQGAPLARAWVGPRHRPAPAGALARFIQAGWHRRWEGLPLTFTVWTTIAVIVASLFEIIPTFLIKSNVPTIR